MNKNIFEEKNIHEYIRIFKHFKKFKKFGADICQHFQDLRFSDLQKIFARKGFQHVLILFEI